MSESDDKRFTKTGVYRVTREAIEEALRSQAIQTGEYELPRSAQPTPDITESKLPLRTVLALVAFAITQVLAITGVYYDLRGDVRSLQEAAGSDRPEVELAELRLRVSQLEKDVGRVEKNIQQPPTVMDNMHRVGELNADVRELGARVGSLERAAGEGSD